MAQLALNLAIGFAANALISLLTPNQKQEGPRLSDLSAPKSNYGVQIPKVWGSVRLAGNLIWANPIKEVTHKKRGGKGTKPQTTTYSYYGDFAMLLCAGPIVGVRRIWLSSKLVYDVSTEADSETFENSLEFRDNYLRIYTGTVMQLPDPLIQASEGIEHTPAYRHRAYIVFHDLPLEEYGNRFPTLTAEVCTEGYIDPTGRIVAHKASLAAIIEEICVATGLGVSEMDITSAAVAVTGFFINNSQSARESLSQLQQAYFFDCVESNGILKFINQMVFGSLQQLPIGSTAAYEYGNNRPNNFTETRTQDLELPSEVSVTYLDPSLNYAESVQYSRKSVAFNSNAQSISLPIVLAPSEARTIADRLLYMSWTRRRTYKFTLLPQSLLLEPGDVISVPFRNGELVDIQINKINIGANLLLEIEANSYEPNIYLHQGIVESEHCETIDNDEGENIYQLSRKHLLAIASVRSGSTTTYTPGIDYTYDLNAGTLTRDTGGSIPDGAELKICYRLNETSPPPQPIVVGGDTTLRVLDINLIADNDTDNGLYLFGDGGPNWRNAAIYVSRDGGASYDFAKNLATRSTFGVCNTVLGSGSTTLQVQIRSGELESVSLAALESGENTALVGNEIIRFQSAVLIAPNTYQLSDLLRGRRGTEWAIATHTAGEDFYLLSGYNERVQGQTVDIGRTLHFKAITSGQTLQSVSPVVITPAGNSLKPYAPISLAAIKDPLGNITLSWIRRDRHAGDRTDYANFSLSEAFERYEIDVYAGAMAIRTLNTTSPTVDYTAAQQLVDFGSVQPTVSIGVYQLSGIVGRGYRANATLTPGIVYPPPTISGLVPEQGAIGSSVVISGSGFTGATAVAFNGIPANFAIDSDSQITATVPSLATSGAITVTTPGGTASST